MRSIAHRGWHTHDIAWLSVHLPQLSSTMSSSKKTKCRGQKVWTPFLIKCFIIIHLQQMHKLGLQSGLNLSHLPDMTQVRVAAEFPQDPAWFIYPPLVVTGAKPYWGDTYTKSPAFLPESEIEEVYVRTSGFVAHSQTTDLQYVAVETQATSLTESYAPRGPTGFSQWGHVTELTAAMPTSDPLISAPSTQVQQTLQALGHPQPYPLSWVQEVFAFAPMRHEGDCGTAPGIGVIRVGVVFCCNQNYTNFILDRRRSICYGFQWPCYSITTLAQHSQWTPPLHHHLLSQHQILQPVQRW